MSQKKLVKNYIYNTLYQILVLLTPLITTPYVSRVLGVTNIGIYQYAQSIASYFVLIGAVGTTLYGQKEIAYLQDKPRERTTAFWEIEIFRLCSTLICSVIYYFVFCIQGIYSQIYLILILEVIATAFDITWLYMGMENFKLTVIRNTIIKLSGVACVFLFVKKPEDLSIYTICLTAPIFLGNISLWFSLKKYLVKLKLSINELFIGIKNRLKPIFILFLPQVAMDVYLLLDKTMIGIFGSSIDQVGFYGQAQKLVKIVLMIITSLGTVMLPTMSAFFARGDKEGIIKNVKTAFRFIYMISFPLLFGLCAISSRFVPLFFGAGYDPVINLIIIISPILVIIATSNVLGKQFLLPTNQQTAFTRSIFVGAGVNFVLNIVFIHFWDAIGASIATVIAELAVTLTQYFSVKKQLPMRECLKPGLKYAVFSFLMFLGVKAVDYFMPGSDTIVLITMIIIGVAIYFFELIVTKDPLLKMSVYLVKYNRR